jgi:hypothetical protein
MILLGVGSKIYLKKTKLGDTKRVLDIFWLKLLSTVFIVIGTLGFITLLITFYYYLKYEGYL